MTNSLIQLFKNDSVQKVKFGQVRSLASDWCVFSFAWLIWLSQNALTFLENWPIRSERKYRRRLAVHPKGSTLIRGVRRKNDQSPTQLKYENGPKNLFSTTKMSKSELIHRLCGNISQNMKFPKSWKIIGKFFARIFTPLMNHNVLTKTFIFHIYLNSFGSKLKN